MKLEFKQDEEKNQELEFELEKPVEENIGAKVVNILPEQQKADVKEQEPAFNLADA
jgi:hypothetical protein